MAVPLTSIDNSVAWTLAFAPLIFVLIDVLLGGITSVGLAFSSLSITVAVGLNLFLAWLDSKRLQAVGYPISSEMAWLVPVYLFKRSAMLRQTLILPIIWCIMFLISLASPTIIGNTLGVPLDSAVIQTSISTELAKVEPSVSVECPPNLRVKVGAHFSCIARANGASAEVDVTLQSTDGYIVWRVLG